VQGHPEMTQQVLKITTDLTQRFPNNIPSKYSSNSKFYNTNNGFGEFAFRLNEKTD